MYAEFASQAVGHVQIVVETLADVQFLQRSVITNLRGDMISSVTIYGSMSPQDMDSLTSSLNVVGVDSIVIKKDFVEFYLDNSSKKSTQNDDEKNGGGEEKEKNDMSDDMDLSNKTDDAGTSSVNDGQQDSSNDHLEPVKKRRMFLEVIQRFFTMILLLGSIIGLYYCLDNGSFRQFARAYIVDQFELIRSYFDGKQHESNDGTNGNLENSPLINGGHHPFFLDTDSPPNNVVLQWRSYSAERNEQSFGIFTSLYALTQCIQTLSY